jgi:hypothetical protein
LIGSWEKVTDQCELDGMKINYNYTAHGLAQTSHLSQWQLKIKKKNGSRTWLQSPALKNKTKYELDFCLPTFSLSQPC